MRDTFPVRGIQRVQNLPGVFDGQFERKWAPQWSSFDKLHDEIVGTNVVEMANVRMVEGGDYLRFQSESFTEWTGACLDRHFAMETRVGCPIDLAHAARGHERIDAVRSQ
jgi:hypothetical protein